MQIPLVSTITLIAELVIGFLIFYVVYRGYSKNSYPRKTAIFALAYEVVFKVGYMVYRTVGQPVASGFSPAMKIVAAIHGLLSLVMLIAVIMIFWRAGKEYAKQVNSFLVHKLQTFIFVSFWAISLLSGIFLYIKAYF